MTRGEKINLMIIKNKTSVKELAEYIGMSDKNLYRIINGQVKNPAPETFHKMAEFLHCTLEDIVVNDIDEENIFYSDENILKHLPKDLRDFVLNEESTPFITVGLMMKEYENDLSKLSAFKMGILIDWLQNEVNKSKVE